jgi:hypothetical protein
MNRKVSVAIARLKRWWCRQFGHKPEFRYDDAGHLSHVCARCGFVFEPTRRWTVK